MKMRVWAKSSEQGFSLVESSIANLHASLGGNGSISAPLHAPGHAVTVNGGASDGHVFGSVVGKTVSMNGVTNLDYDEELGSDGLINNYESASWFEDTR